MGRRTGDSCSAKRRHNQREGVMRWLAWSVPIVLGIGAWAMLAVRRDAPSAWARITGLPSGQGISWKVVNGYPTALVDGIPLGEIPGVRGPNIGVVNYGAAPTTEHGRIYLARHQRFAAFLSAQFTARRLALPKDALPANVDVYSKELYSLPSWAVLGSKVTLWDIQTTVVTPRDEYGRGKPGHYGSGGGIGDMFVRLTQNPLFGVVLSVAVVAFGGPAGVAALGAYNMWQARGQEFSLKSIALTAARTAAVSQCGEACGMAFDMGVGVMQGKTVDRAAEDALLGKMTPQQRAVYDQGRAAYKQAS
jgi:hypothetical protein